MRVIRDILAGRCAARGMLYGFCVALLTLVLVACGPAPADAASTRYVTVANGPVEFAFPDGWYANPQEHPFDLQWFAKYERMNTGVFLFAKEDLAEGVAPRTYLERQIADLRSKRKNFVVVEAEQVVQLAGKKLTSIVYAAEKGDSRDYYRFTLIEFAAQPELIPVVLQISVPSYWHENKPVLESITASARVRPAAPRAPLK